MSKANREKRTRSAVPDNLPPYVVGAMLANQVLIEKDNTVSAIRIIDRFQVDGLIDIVEPNDVDVSNVPAPVQIAFTFLAMFKGFATAGEHTIATRPYDSTGEPMSEPRLSKVFAKGAMLGGNLYMPAEIWVSLPGVHTIRVFYEDRELTRAFFEIEDRRTRRRISSVEEAHPDALVLVRRPGEES